MKILFTEGSSTSAREALYALGPRHTVDVLDSNPLCQCRFSRYIRTLHRCPPFARDPQAYLRFLMQLIRSERYDVLLPTHEQVFLVSRVREALQSHVGLAVPDFDALERVIGKADFVRLLDEVGLPHPRTKIVSDRASLLRLNDYPYYLKMSHSTAGEGVRRVDSAEQLTAAVEEFQRRGWLDGCSELLVQEPARGENRGVNGIFQHGRLVASHCTQLQCDNRGGWFIVVESVSHPEAVEHLRILGQHLNWHGAMSLEYFYDTERDQCQYIECNPRIGETFNAMLSGVNLCEQLVRVSVGEDLEPLPPGEPGRKCHQSFLVLMAKGWAGASRVELLRELWQQLSGRSFYRDSQDTLTRPGEDPLSLLPRVAMTAQLLVWPSSARRIVRKTVENYSLSPLAVQAIRKMR